MENEISLIKQFAALVTTEYDVSHVTLYRGSEKIYGDTLDCFMLERYLSISCTTIFKGVNSSLVSHIKNANNLYILVLTSESADAFDGVEAQYIINEIKNLQRKLGESK